MFSTLELHDTILKAITEKGYTTPTPIQAQSIPVILEGKDLLGCAQTGTGKTAAFCIPLLQRLHSKKIDIKNKKRPIRSLILTPTRELAIQVQQSLYVYGKYTNLSSTVICGGLSKDKQIRSLQRGIDILIATPGRLLDIMREYNLNLSQIEIFVLDEADRMLDMGFIDDVNYIIHKLPKNRQSLFFSATMEAAIAKLSNSILCNPTNITVAPVSSTAKTIKQSIYFVDKDNKNDLLIDILNNPDITSCLIFTKTKYSADKVVKLLNQQGIKSDAIHGDKNQNARQAALNKFKDKQVRVLVATDIASRGIDIDHLEYVLNYDIPNVAETYVHRIGRSGRAGRNGIALSFCDVEERAFLRSIEKLINKKIEVIDNHAYPAINITEHRPSKKSNSRTRNGDSISQKINKPSNNTDQRRRKPKNKDSHKVGIITQNVSNTTPSTKPKQKLTNKPSKFGKSFNIEKVPAIQMPFRDKVKAKKSNAKRSLVI